MQNSRKRTVLAMGSVMDFWPRRDYAEYLPRGSLQQRMGRYWTATGRYLKQGKERYEQQRAQ
jgi:hypothetical protein